MQLLFISIAQDLKQSLPANSVLDFLIVIKTTFSSLWSHVILMLRATGLFDFIRFPKVLLIEVSIQKVVKIVLAASLTHYL